MVLEYLAVERTTSVSLTYAAVDYYEAAHTVRFISTINSVVWLLAEIIGKLTDGNTK